MKEVRKKIDAEGVTYVYYQFISVTGRIMGKGVPAPHWETIAAEGLPARLRLDGEPLHRSPRRLHRLRPRGVGAGRHPRARDVRGPPWDSRVARVWCTCFRNREDRDGPGAFLTSDCRGNLRRIQEEFEGRTGMHLRAGMEPEMMWLRLNPDGTPSVEGKTKPYCYHIDQFSELQPIIHKMVEYGQKLGLDMIQGDHEDAPGQIELNFGFDRAEKTADNLSTFRQIAKQVGREEGAFPCFMPKPFMGVSANGCHTNISLWKGDENVFLPDGDDVHMPSQIGLNAVGGILEHLRALTCVTASTVNSYRRFWETGFWAPVFADWGYQNRTTALRISSPDRFEYRSVDSAVNPYLALAALIKVMDDGIERKLDPGPPEESNIYEAIEAGKDGEAGPDDARRGARGARSGRRREGRAAGRDVPCVHALQARRVGALLRHRLRLGRAGIPRCPAVRARRGRPKGRPTSARRGEACLALRRRRHA